MHPSFALPRRPDEAAESGIGFLALQRLDSSPGYIATQNLSASSHDDRIAARALAALIICI